MSKPSDPVSSVDWTTVPEARMVATVASVLRAKQANEAFHALAYAWLVMTLFTAFFLRPEHLPWAVMASGIAVIGLARLGAWARRARDDRDSTLAALATDHPSRT